MAAAVMIAPVAAVVAATVAVVTATVAVVTATVAAMVIGVGEGDGTTEERQGCGRGK
jgi:Spy/CpxP family protein refolding chaperone